MLKETIRGLLEDRQKQVYRLRLRRQHITYHDWVTDWEAEAAGAPAGFEGTLHTASYRVLEDAEERDRLLRLPDKDAVVLHGDSGALTRPALRYIERCFAAHPEIALLYGDEDELRPDGRYDRPYFKPDWSPDTYLAMFYIGSIYAVRVGALRDACADGWPEAGDVPPESQMCAADRLFYLLAKRAGGFRIRDGITFPIGHVDEILFHRGAAQDIFYGRGVQAVPHAPQGEVRLSIVIPSKDQPGLLEVCVDSVLKERGVSAGKERISYEIILVDNGSSAQNRMRITEYLEGLKRENGLCGLQYLYRPMPFNFSRMCNMGAEAAKGDYLLFLNDDIEVAAPGWLREMAAAAELPYAGAVGAKLLYPDSDRIQHVGITNVRLGPMHKMQKMHDAEAHYFGFNRGVHDMIAVTGACLMVRRDRFLEAGGFREALAVAFNDVDLCYTLFEKGYYNICCSDIFLYHHESLSRGNDTKDQKKMDRLTREHDVLMERHQALYNWDPFYHKYLSDDEHISEVVRATDELSVEEMPYAEVRKRRNGCPEKWEDPVLRIGVEYANTVNRFVQFKNFQENEAENGYFIKGYSFVIGADNAFYDRRLLLRPAEGPSAQPRPTERTVYVVQVCDWYRPDIEAHLEGQRSVELTGFRARIAKDALPPGTYQVGMLCIDRTSRQRLVNWAPNLLLVHRVGAK